MHLHFIRYPAWVLVISSRHPWHSQLCGLFQVICHHLFSAVRRIGSQKLPMNEAILTSSCPRNTQRSIPFSVWMTRFSSSYKTPKVSPSSFPTNILRHSRWEKSISTDRPSQFGNGTKDLCLPHYPRQSSPSHSPFPGRLDCPENQGWQAGAAVLWRHDNGWWSCRESEQIRWSLGTDE